MYEYESMKIHQLKINLLFALIAYTFFYYELTKNLLDVYCSPFLQNKLLYDGINRLPLFLYIYNIPHLVEDWQYSPI
jgi:hypothetical protein